MLHSPRSQKRCVSGHRILILFNFEHGNVHGATQRAQRGPPSSSAGYKHRHARPAAKLLIITFRCLSATPWQHERRVRPRDGFCEGGLPTGINGYGRSGTARQSDVTNDRFQTHFGYRVCSLFAIPSLSSVSRAASKRPRSSRYRGGGALGERAARLQFACEAVEASGFLTDSTNVAKTRSVWVN